MSNITVTIGNTNPSDFADYLESTGFTGSCQITPTLGFWNGFREESISVTFYDRTSFFACSFLHQYGETHPEEEAFGLVESSFSKLIDNPHHRSDEASESVPDVFPEDWA